MKKSLSLLVVLLLTLQIAFCQATLPKSSPRTVSDSICLTNEEARVVNQVFLDRDKCYEELKLEKDYSKGKDTVNLLQKDIIGRLNLIDSLHTNALDQYKGLVALQNAKFKDINDSWVKYTQSLKKQNKRSTAIVVIVLTVVGASFGLGFGLHH